MKYSYKAYSATCPVCQYKKNKKLYDIPARKAASSFASSQLNHGDELVDAITDNIKRLWKKNSAVVVKCSNCGFCFSDPYVSGDYEFYNLISHAGTDEAEYSKWEFDITLKNLSNIESNQKITLLEIGASTGGFAKKAANFIDKKNILCLDPSEEAIKKLREKNFEAYSWDFRELRKKKEYAGYFDAICLFQVLEHLDRIEDTFATFKYLIKPGGHLFISVPNGERIKFNELHNALLDIPPNHLGRYSPATFELLGKRYGWTIEDIAIEPTTSLTIMRGVMYYQSLARYQGVVSNLSGINQYLQIKLMRLKTFLMCKQLGDALWVHYKSNQK
jgi:2-polyprenyl-3-methyl-5-hydroxy-6-metoxy-1,4-benzoquinol methylase